MMIQSFVCIMMISLIGSNISYVHGQPRRILVDTDVDVDDILALVYILKLDRTNFDLQAITINTNSWTNAGHAVNEIYDLLYMMGRDDIAVGVGGEGGILEDGTINSDVGGYLPIIEQSKGTSGYCRYSQVIPLGSGGKLNIDTKYGFRKSILPQGNRTYSPMRQPTTQQVMIDTISEGPTTVFILGASTNLAIFLMSNPKLKKNIEHIYISGGGVGARNSNLQCCNYSGNVYTGYNTDPNAEYNMFSDPFAAYQVIHSGIPVTLVPLDATDTIPITNEFLHELEMNQHTYEAQYCFNILKMVRDTWFNDEFFKIFFMWDSLLAGVATSIMLKQNNTNGENDFAEMKYMNITVITSNEPYGILDGSNPFSYGSKKPIFNLTRNGVHSGHVVTGPTDAFCLSKTDGCKDGYTPEVTGQEGVRVLVAVKAKPNRDENTTLDKELYKNFLDVINQPKQTGKFNFTTQYPNYTEVIHKPDFNGRQLGKNVVLDMDMSAGDFLALFYLLKVPIETINLKAILVTPTGWANAATIDVIYDLLHMMGRDDIPVGLGDVYALNQTNPNFASIGDCNYSRAIQHGSGGYLDSDTLYGLARNMPRSPRRYTAESSMKFGAPRDTDHPELRQPLALEVWQSVIKSLDPGSNVTILTNGPLTNVAQIILADKNMISPIQEIIVVGGHISSNRRDIGNLVNIISNRYAEVNMFLDPLAAKTVFDSGYHITLIPLSVQRTVRDFGRVLQSLRTKKTPEALLAGRLLSILQSLKPIYHTYYGHVDLFLGEILGAVILADDSPVLKTSYARKKVEVYATGVESEDGRMVINEKNGSNWVNVLEHVLDHVAYYDAFANRLGDKNQSAVIGSFEEQKKMWSAPQT
ncbi:hypothetical protein OROMI_005852 [Orobanche minor]